MKIKYLKLSAIAVISIALGLTSCKKEGCTDMTAKNYDAEAEKDDESCEYYTNTEFLTMDTWNYLSASSDDADMTAMVDTFMTGASFDYSADASFSGNIPSSDNPALSGTWEFNSDETELTMYENNQSGDVDTIIFKIDNLDAETFVAKVDQDTSSTGSIEVIYTFIHE